MTAEQLHDLLVANDIIAEDDTPNSTDEYKATCFECGKKKLFIHSGDDPKEVGVYFCQSCEAKGNADDLLKRFEEPTEEQFTYRSFHEYAVRKLLSNQEALDDLFERDFTEDDIKEFGFGYVGKNFVTDIVKTGITKAQLHEYGFINLEERPVFWNHLIIPYLNGNSYENFKGRCLDEDAKVKYIGLSGHDATLYGSADLQKKGRVFLTEGEFKRCYLKANGFNAVSLSGANNFNRHLPALREVDDLWIVLDCDQPTERNPLGVGQAAAIKIAEQLDHCHVVWLPLARESKLGVDDYLRTTGVDAFEVLLGNADYYVAGKKQKSRSLSVIVTDWAEKTKALKEQPGFNIGFDRLDEWMHGLQSGFLTYIIGAPHSGKTFLERAMGVKLYQNNPELLIDVHSNDDSLKATIAQYVALIGWLNKTDTTEPSIAFNGDPKGMRKWEKAVATLASMQDRMTIVDRSFRISLEEIYENVMRWREKNPDGQRVILIDGFSKIYSKTANKKEDERRQTNAKSDQLKRIAQEADIAVVSTIEPPKLYGRRPKSFDIANSAMGEFDGDIILSTYVEAQVVGTDNTDLKMDIDGEDVPFMEVNLHKNKQNDYLDLDLFIVRRDTSQLEELDDEEHRRGRSAVMKAMNGEKKAK
jgi:KaiC/GvpD/RAD55 family RecA-like ATPase